MRVLKISAALVIGLVVVAFGLLQFSTVQDRLIDQVIHKRMGNSDRQQLFADDALRLLVCGSSSPLPSEDRARPCLAVIAGGKFYLVDTGPGSWNRLALLRIPGEKIAGVFITHFHSDHIGDLGEVNLQTWVAGRPEPLQVVGPQGVDTVVAGFTEAYSLDTKYRIEHHGAKLLPPEVEPMVPRSFSLEGDEATVVLESGDLKVSAFRVAHDPVKPAVGYRFDYKGRSIVISGDTRKDEQIARMAKGADLLVHEAQSQHIVRMMKAIAEKLDKPRYAKILGDIRTYHTDPLEAAELANEAGVRKLLLYHLTPPPPNWIAARVFLRGMNKVRPGTTLAQDGTLVSIPLDGSAIKQTVLH